MHDNMMTNHEFGAIADIFPVMDDERLAALRKKRMKTTAMAGTTEEDEAQTHEIVGHDYHFHLEACGVRVTGKPTFAQWQQFMYALSVADGSIHWWIGDAVNYGEAAYGEKYAQALDETRFAYETIAHDSWVAKQFEFWRRRQNLSWSHHREVAGLPPEQQDALLDEAEKNAWSKQELRQEVRALSHEDTPPLPEGTYRVLLADPPWRYDNSGLGGAAEKHYATMSIEELCQLPLAELVADNAVLFCWTTNPLLEEAFTVIKTWGFAYKTNLCWLKQGRPTYGKLGFYVYGRHELLLVATKGSMLPQFIPESIIDERKSEHSRKPDAVYDLIEKMYPKPPDEKYLELFARRRHSEQWVIWGLEAQP